MEVVAHQAEQLGDTFGAVGGVCLGLDAHFPAAHKYIVMWRNLSLFSRHQFFNTEPLNSCKPLKVWMRGSRMLENIGYISFERGICVCTE